MGMLLALLAVVLLIPPHAVAHRCVLFAVVCALLQIRCPVRALRLLLKTCVARCHPRSFPGRQRCPGQRHKCCVCQTQTAPLLA